MDVEELRKLIRLMDEAGLTELEIEDRSGKVRLVRGAARKQRRAADDASSAENCDSSGAFALAGGDAADAGYDERGSETMMRERLALAADGNTVVTSPMVGTFYRSSAPDADPFVSTGDVVQPGQLLCIIEAMKMMNEIHAEVGGRIVGITAENGSPVEYGSPLFLIAALD